MADSGGEQTKTRDVDDLLADVDDITADDGDATTGSSVDTADHADSRERASRETNQGGSRLRERMDGVFSLRTFLVALVLTAVGAGLGGGIPLLSSIPVVGILLGFIGVFLGGFVLGAVSENRHYPEAGLAGGLVTGVSALSNYFLWSVVGAGLVVVAVNAGIGVLAGLVGHYFGRDLRDGLTRDL